MRIELGMELVILAVAVYVQSYFSHWQSRFFILFEIIELFRLTWW